VNEQLLHMDLRTILAARRIPNYHKFADKLSPAEYIEQASRKEIYNPILTFQFSNDFQVARLMHKYLPEDKKSLGYDTLRHHPLF